MRGGKVQTSCDLHVPCLDWKRKIHGNILQSCSPRTILPLFGARTLDSTVATFRSDAKISLHKYRLKTSLPARSIRPECQNQAPKEI
jgi:hypothetical protein